MTSTIAFILLNPIFSNRSFNHLGLSLLVIPSINLPEKRLQNCVFPYESIKTGIVFSVSLIVLIFTSWSLPTPLAAKSLAIPYTPKQSGLFGVIAISITGSIELNAEIAFVPGSKSLSISIIPSLSSPRLSSSA